MAHADYDCCAICDSKQSYNAGGDVAKGEICGECVANLARLGVITGTPEELLAWIKGADPAKVKEVLHGVGFHTCYYGNLIDDAVNAMHPNEFEGRFAFLQRKSDLVEPEWSRLMNGIA